LVLFIIWITDGVDVNVVVNTGRVVAVIGLEHRRIVMASARFVSTLELAHQPATASRMVTSRTTDICDPDCICCSEEEKWVIAMELLITCIPDEEPLALKCGEVIYAREEE
jgi:hypothetical protein